MSVSFVIKGCEGGYLLYERAFHGPPVEYRCLAGLTDAEARALAASRLVEPHAYCNVAPTIKGETRPSDLLTLVQDEEGFWQVRLDLPAVELPGRSAARTFDLPDWERILRESRHGTEGLVNLVTRTGISVEIGSERLRRMASAGSESVDEAIQAPPTR